MIKCKIKWSKAKNKQKIKTRKEGISKRLKRKWATVSGSDIGGPGIPVHSQESEDARLQEVMPEVCLCSGETWWADFWFVLGPGFHFIKGFISVYNFVTNTDSIQPKSESMTACDFDYDFRIIIIFIIQCRTTSIIRNTKNHPDKI